MVSARKNKARLDKTALTRLKKKNAASQAKEMELTPEALGRVGDELVNATIQGFNEELASSPAPIRALAKQFSGLIEEFFKGFKEGVNAEISEFVKNNRKISETTIEDIEKVTTTNIKALAETVTDVVPDKQAALPLTKEKTDKAVSTILARKDGNAGSVLDKKTNFKDFLIRAGLGTIGQEGAAEAIISKRQAKEAFVQTETKLRSEEFKGMSSEDVKKKLEEDYKIIQTTTQELKKLEEQISTYKDMGYTPEQMTKLGVDDKKKQLVQQAIKADPSRMAEYTKYVEGDTTTNNDNRQPSTTTSNTDNGARNTNFKDESVKTQSTSVLEENLQEQKIVQEAAAKDQSQQITLLTEIRDLLKKQKEQEAKTTQERAAPAQQDTSGGGNNIDVDLPDRKGTRGPSKGTFGKSLKNMLPRAGALARAAGPIAAAGAITLGAINMADTGLGSLGVGKDAEGNALKIDEKQDDENWKKASFFEKVQSSIPRGLEKVGGFLGLDNLTTEARAKRITSETEYLKKKTATVEDTTKPAEPSIGINEQVFLNNDPENYQKFVQYRIERIKQIPQEEERKNKGSGSRNEPLSAAARYKIGTDAAIEKFKKEIEAAGASVAKDGAPTPEKTSTEQKTAAEAKQTAQIEKVAPGAVPPEAVSAPNAPPGVPVAAEGRKIADIANPESTAAVRVPAQPPRELVKTSNGTFMPGAPAAPASEGATKESIDISFSEASFAKNDPENYQKFVKELESRTETLTEKYFSSGRFGKAEQAKQMAQRIARADAKKETILKFKKEIEAAGAGAVTITKEGAPKEQPAPVGQAAGATPVPEQAPNQPPEARQIPPGAPNAPPGVPAAPAKTGFFSNLINKVKNFFGMGTPTVEPTRGVQKVPDQLMGAAARAGPNWAARLSEYDKSPKDTPVANLESQYPGITKEFIAIAKESVPTTDVPQSIDSHEQMLVTKAIQKMSGSGSAVPMEKTATGAPEGAGSAWQPAGGAPKPAGVAKLQALQAEAKKQGIAGEVSGTFEGGVLTGITDAAGKKYPVEVKEADKRNVDVARSMRAANEGSNIAEQAVIDRETAQPKQMPSALKQAPVDATAMNAAAAMGKNITIQSPPPVVVPAAGGGGGGGQTIMPQPFTSNIRNPETTLNKYLVSRYLTA